MTSMDGNEAISPELLVTNFHRRFTGVSATANAVVGRQQSLYDLQLIGNALPLAPPPISYFTALKLSRTPRADRPFMIWHVRRNLEMSAAIFARDVLRLPVRIVFTSAAQRLHSPIPRRLIARMDAVIATTEKAASFVPNVAAVVPHGVDVARFTPAVDRVAEWQQAGHHGKFGIGIVGRIRPEKGTDLFVEALCQVLPQRPDFTAMIIGLAKPSERAFEQMLREKIARAGLSERFHFVGEIPSADMPNVMRRLSLLVAPARYEGFGMTPLEAMASGVAVVAADTGAYSAMLEGGEVGRVVPLGDSARLAQAILEITNDPTELHERGMLGRKRTVAQFSLEGEVRRIGEVYEQLWRGAQIKTRAA